MESITRRLAEDIISVFELDGYIADFGCIAVPTVSEAFYAPNSPTFPPSGKNYKHFYGGMFTEIYRGMRKLMI